MFQATGRSHSQRFSMSGIRIKIAGVEKAYEDVDESWVAQQINRRRADHQAVCVQVMVDVPGINLALSTPTCGDGGGGGRAPNAREPEIFELWAKHHLDQVSFSVGDLTSFLKQLSR